ncbi:MAG: serine/threonine protein kinase [Gemmataceae bacterium]
MAVSTQLDEFKDNVCQSGLIDDKQLEDMWRRSIAAMNGSLDSSKMAARLVTAGLLTRYQARQLLLHKGEGLRIGKYRVLDLLGSGGMGEVYLCTHPVMRRLVAVKVISLEKCQDQEIVQRFFREARAAGMLDHPNIVHAYDVDCEGQRHFMVLEYVEGINLRQLVQKIGPLPFERAAHYIRQAAQGLQYAFEAGWVHRDIKPGNILVDRQGVIKILDMGLARLFEDESDMLTMQYNEKGILGTADYLSPEQAVNSHKVDIRTDIYSLGATFYYLLTGKTPFEGATVAQKLIAHQKKEPTAISRMRSDVPPDLEMVIRKMMAKKPDDRYATPAAVAEALAPWTQQPIPPPSDAEIPPPSPAISNASQLDWHSSSNNLLGGVPAAQGSSVTPKSTSLSQGAPAKGSVLPQPAPQDKHNPFALPSEDQKPRRRLRDLIPEVGDSFSEIQLPSEKAAQHRQLLLGLALALGALIGWLIWWWRTGG